MRFTRLETHAFGPLEARALEVDCDIVLVCGPNEAGKSSFRAAIETLLYGFRPADRNLHPLAQWDPDHPQTLRIACELRLDGGDRLRVERVLQSAVRSRIWSNGEEGPGRNLANRPLPCVDWLARDVFLELYSLELEQLAELDPSARADIDDLLMPHTSALPLRPASEIRAELDAEAKQLWRFDRRGNTRERELRRRLANARDKLAAARQRDRELRDARAERAEIERELDALGARKRELDAERADAEFLGALFDWNRGLRALGPAIDLAALGERRLVRPRELDAEIEALQDKLREPRARIAREPRGCGEAAERLLAIAPDVEAALERFAGWSADRERHAEQRRQAAGARGRARDELRAALGGQPADDALERVAALPIEVLSSVAGAWSEARDRELAARSAPGGRAQIAEIAAAIAGGAAIVFGVIPPPHWGLIGLGALLLGGALALGWRARSAARPDPVQPPDELGALLQGLELPGSFAQSPAALQRLVAVLDGAQRALAQAREHARTADALDTRLSTCERSWRELCARAGLAVEGDGEALVARLRAALHAAREEAEAVEDDGRERAEAQRLIEFEQPALDAKLEHREQLRAVLRASEPECADFDEAYQRVEQRRDVADYLRRLGAELNRDPRFARYERDPRVIAEQLPEDAPWRDEVADAREAELRELDASISAKQRRLGELGELLSGDAPGAVAAAAEEELEVRGEIASCERERDRLALLESILAHAERAFREAHQPDVLRRASAYIERITGGRYRRIEVLDDGSGLLGVALDGRSEPIEVCAPISRGTLDQIFLCLRLGMLDHLDDGRERLPLILDDALLRMDDQRRRGVYALLGELAPTRQVWILTCHGALADEVEGDLEVSRIDL